jgi:hypothetical protein
MTVSLSSTMPGAQLLLVAASIRPLGGFRMGPPLVTCSQERKSVPPPREGRRVAAHGVRAFRLRAWLHGSRDPVDMPREVEVKIGDPALGVIGWAIGNADRTERLARLTGAVRGKPEDSKAPGRQRNVN